MISILNKPTNLIIAKYNSFTYTCSPVDVGILFFDGTSAHSRTDHNVIGVHLLLTVALH